MKTQIAVPPVLEEAQIKLSEFDGGTDRGPCLQVTGVLDDMGHPHMLHLTATEARALGQALQYWAQKHE